MDNTPDEQDVFERSEDGIVTVQIGSLSVGFKHLNGSESQKAESLAMAQTDVGRAYARALFAVRDINGTKFDPKAQSDLDRVSSRFSDQEQDVYLLAYAAAFRNDALEEQAKNLAARLKPA